MQPSAVVLRAGPATVTLCPDAGGRIGQIEVDGRKLLRGPEDAGLGWGYWGSYPLLPWSNRIPGGRFRFEGRDFTVPVNWEDGSALHGLAMNAPWTVVAASDRSAVIEIAIDSASYRMHARQSFVLTQSGLDQRIDLTNRSADRVPVGAGIHPWFGFGPIRVPADRMWPGSGPIPEGVPVPVEGDADLRVICEPGLMDRCYTALTADRVEVPGLRLGWSGPITHVVVYTGTPGWVCVEPVTMANDGFRLADEGVPGAGVIALDEGDTLSVGYRFDWSA
ncbi:MAG: hypothetical protein H0W70_01310 [Actinobacteria bacterium]|nr:hypothetical protein [Actinomycetota bacterium]